MCQIAGWQEFLGSRDQRDGTFLGSLDRAFNRRIMPSARQSSLMGFHWRSQHGSLRRASLLRWLLLWARQLSRSLSRLHGSRLEPFRPSWLLQRSPPHESIPERQCLFGFFEQRKGWLEHFNEPKDELWEFERCSARHVRTRLHGLPKRVRMVLAAWIFGYENGLAPRRFWLLQERSHWSQNA